MTHRITILKVIREEVQETTEAYFHNKTGEKLDWSAWYKLSEKEQAQYSKKQIPTGETNVKERTEKIYEQEKEDLDVADVSLYINRGR